MLTKVYFPRLVIPLTAVLSKLVDFAIAFVLVSVLMLWFRIPPTVNILYLPLLILLMMGTRRRHGPLALGAGFAVPRRQARHDLCHHAADVRRPCGLARFPDYAIASARQSGSSMGLYPMVGVIEGFRAALLGANPMPWDLIGIGSISTLVLLISGLFYFKRMEHTFADVA